MTITLNNYEECLIDHLDGKLSEEMQTELRAFLIMHTELGLSLDDLALPVLDRENISGGLHEELFKFQTPSEEDVCRYLEGLMSLNEKTAFEKRALADPKLGAELHAFKKAFLPKEELFFPHKESLLKKEDESILQNKALACVEGLLPEEEVAAITRDPELSKEIRQFELTRLTADPRIIFENKDLLKKSARVIPLFSLRVIAAAASLVLIAMLAVLFTLFSKSESVQVASKIPERSTNATNSSPERKQPAELLVPKIQDAPARESKQSRVKIKNIALVNAADDASLAAETESEATKILSDNTETALTGKMPEVQQNAENKFEEIGLSATQPDSAEKKRAVFSLNDLPVVEDELVYNEEQEEDSRISLWQRVTRLAGEANRLGVKAIDGEVGEDEGFRLRISSMSIEKK